MMNPRSRLLRFGNALRLMLIGACLSIAATAQVRINTGGGANGTFAADSSYQGGTVATTTKTISTAGVTNPAPQAVYQSERYGACTYTIKGLSAGAPYTARLHFAEVYFTATGKRLFNVAINGSQVLNNFDIYSAAGGASKAIVREFSATASGGQVVIAFSAGNANNPKICGIELLPAPGLSFTTQPVSQSVGLGQSATFTAVAAGSPAPTYQWQRFVNAAWTNLTDATAASYTTAATTNDDNNAQFRVVASNSLNTITSSIATLTVTIPRVSTPTFSPAGGTYATEQTVAITCATPGSTIRYTTDNTTPDISSPVYSGLITVTETTTVKAYASAIDLADSQVASATYTIQAFSGIRINCGGPAIPPSWLADSYYLGGTIATANKAIDTSGTSHPAPPAVYQTERWGACTYTIPGLTASTSYLVRLHFAETYFTGVGKRKFNVAINGQNVLSNFDIYATAGTGNKAVTREFTATANAQGQVVIAFSVGAANNPKICGIEVELGGAPPPVPQQLVFLGTYTSGSSQGIYVYSMDPVTGALTYICASPKTSNPSYLALHPNKKWLYAVNENSAGTISAFSYDSVQQKLTYINSASSMGNAPAYISIDNSGKFVLVANYTSGNVAVCPINADGSLGAATSVDQHTGSGPVGGRQDGPHAHMIVQTPSNFVYSTDLGADKIIPYTLDITNGKLTKTGKDRAAQPGAGPRHMAFHPNQNWAYVVCELNGTVEAYTVNNATSEWTKFQSISTLPSGTTAAAASADIHITPNGQYLYASNRGQNNNIAMYSINQTSGQLSLLGHQSVLGSTPRSFDIDPTGKFLLVACQDSSKVTSFTINPANGLLTSTGIQATVPNPVCVKFANYPQVSGTIQIDVSSILNARAVTTLTDGKLVTWTRGIDGGGLADGYLTLEASLFVGDKNPKALPGNGFIPANAQHPEVQLNYSNADGIGNQTHFVTGAGEFHFDVPSQNYSKLMLFMTSSEGSSQLSISLSYADGTVEQLEKQQQPDYYNSAGMGDPDIFNLVSDLAKWNASNKMTEANHHYIHGLTLHPDTTKKLVSVRVEKTAPGYLVFWGATGMTQ